MVKMNVQRFFVGLCVLALLSACTLTTSYGPYSGKVLDQQTGQPIEGAVVLVQFFTIFDGVEGQFNKYIEAVEVLTDGQGEFHVPSFRLWAVRFFHSWNPEVEIVIFKPGFAVYPHHPMITAEKALPNQTLQIELPRVQGKMERFRNLGYAGAFDQWIIPEEKRKHITKCFREEQEYLELQNNGASS
ncbi:hypothetical protein ACFL6N_02755 [Thermodesulfobacteriota bacterium]